MNKVVLLRHGESLWNLENVFTGWTDVGLTDRGRAEAREAGLLLTAGGFTFDVAHTSVLSRAIATLDITLAEMGLSWIEVKKSWRLNEKHYGALQGLNKKETADEHGLDQVQLWRRSYDAPPPPLDLTDERHPGNDPRYVSLSADEIPATECLADVVSRMLPYWFDAIVPDIRAARKVLIAAHGNSLRALVKHLDGISEDEIAGLNIPTGIPLVYELDGDLHPERSYYLGDPEAVREAARKVADQAGT